jgi:hypothetical protein
MFRNDLKRAPSVSFLESQPGQSAKGRFAILTALARIQFGPLGFFLFDVCAPKVAFGP